MRKRILAIFLCLILTVSLATAAAAKNDVITQRISPGPCRREATFFRRIGPSSLSRTTRTGL